MKKVWKQSTEWITIFLLGGLLFALLMGIMGFVIVGMLIAFVLFIPEDSPSC